MIKNAYYLFIADKCRPLRTIFFFVNEKKIICSISKYVKIWITTDMYVSNLF
jgi:hypothetical protein